MNNDRFHDDPPGNGEYPEKLLAQKEFIRKASQLLVYVPGLGIEIDGNLVMTLKPEPFNGFWIHVLKLAIIKAVNQGGFIYQDL